MPSYFEKKFAADKLSWSQVEQRRPEGSIPSGRDAPVLTYLASNYERPALVYGRVFARAGYAEAHPAFALSTHERPVAGS